MKKLNHFVKLTQKIKTTTKKVFGHKIKIKEEE